MGEDPRSLSREQQDHQADGTIPFGRAAGNQQADERLVRGHLADMVIRLGHRTTKTGQLQRVFQIQKSRSQSHLQGQHVYGIQSGQGVTIYPSVHALLAVWKRQIRRARTSEPESWAVEGLDFNQVLQNDVARGSPLLLSGRPATHKFALGLTFLASGLAAPNTQALLISLQEDEATSIDIIETYPQLHGLLRCKQRLFNPRLRVLHRPPDYFTAERFIDWIRQNLTDMKRRPMAACRVLLHSLDSLRYNSPLFKEEPLFLAAVLELFRKERMTALFIDVQQQPEHELPQGFDTAIITDYGPTPGPLHDPDTVRLRVGSTPQCNAYRDERWIHRRREGLKDTWSSSPLLLSPLRR